MTEAVVAAAGVAYGYDRDLVLDGVDISLHAGRVMGFLGRNGAGKSTTIKLLAGVLQPTRGRVTAFGIDASASAARARVGWAPEEPPLSSSLTVDEHLGLAASLAPAASSTTASRRDELCNALGLEGVTQRLAGALSKGTRQRVGLAMALVGRPDVLLLDEPSAGLDPAQVVALHALVRAEAARGAAVLWSTHVLAELARVADDVTAIAAGRTVFTGPVAALDDAAAAALGAPRAAASGAAP